MHGVMVVYPDDDRAAVGDRKEVRPACDRGEVFVHVAAVRGGHPPRADRACVGALVVRVVAARDRHLAALGALIAVPLQQRLLVRVDARR